MLSFDFACAGFASIVTDLKLPTHCHITNPLLIVAQRCDSLLLVRVVQVIQYALQTSKLVEVSILTITVNWYQSSRSDSRQISADLGR